MRCPDPLEISWDWKLFIYQFISRIVLSLLQRQLVVNRQVELLLLQSLNLLDEVGQRLVATLVGGRLVAQLENEAGQILKFGRHLAHDVLVRVLITGTANKGIVDGTKVRLMANTLSRLMANTLSIYSIKCQLWP